jgi:hypothetical protein
MFHSFADIELKFAQEIAEMSYTCVVEFHGLLMHMGLSQHKPCINWVKM